MGEWKVKKRASRTESPEGRARLGVSLSPRFLDVWHPGSTCCKTGERQAQAWGPDARNCTPDAAPCCPSGPPGARSYSPRGRHRGKQTSWIEPGPVAPVGSLSCPGISRIGHLDPFLCQPGLSAWSRRVLGWGVNRGEGHGAQKGKEVAGPEPRDGASSMLCRSSGPRTPYT